MSNNPLSFIFDFVNMMFSWLPAAPLAVLGIAIILLIGLAIWRCIQ